MCGGSYVGRGFLGRNVEEMGSGARISAALSVLVPVGLSGVFLVVFVPQLWWIFTTYFWVAFPALGLLAGSVSGLEEGAPRISEAGLERELLEALARHGEITAARAALETTLSVAEADRMLSELAKNGHIEVRAREGRLGYALWEHDHRELTG